jgi:hypothetical protein
MKRVVAMAGIDDFPRCGSLWKWRWEEIGRAKCDPERSEGLGLGTGPSYRDPKGRW